MSLVLPDYDESQDRKTNQGLESLEITFEELVVSKLAFRFLVAMLNRTTKSG